MPVVVSRQGSSPWPSHRKKRAIATATAAAKLAALASCRAVPTTGSHEMLFSSFLPSLFSHSLSRSLFPPPPRPHLVDRPSLTQQRPSYKNTRHITHPFPCGSSLRVRDVSPKGHYMDVPMMFPPSPLSKAISQKKTHGVLCCPPRPLLVRTPDTTNTPVSRRNM